MKRILPLVILCCLLLSACGGQADIPSVDTSALEQSIAGLEEKCEALETANADLSAKIDALQSQIDELSAQLQNMESDSNAYVGR